MSFSPEKIRNTIRSAAPGRFLLRLLSLVYSAAIDARRRLYAAGALPSARLPVPVICFGNISAGGTGKTSTVIAAAREVKQMGFRPAILLRGYGRKAPPRKLVLLDGPGEYDAAECGDEAVIIHNALKEYSIPVAVSADRAAAGRAAIEKLGCDILLMDDGFQHFSLRRDRDIVIVNAAAPFHKDAALPLGNLRERKAGLARASMVIISHCERSTGAGLEELHAEIKKINPLAPVAESMHVPEHFIDARRRLPVPLAAVKGKSVSVISAIGDPDSFERNLRELGAGLEGVWRYPDHHRFTAGEIKALSAASGDRPVITTYKDFSRFPTNWERLLAGPLYILSVRITFLCDGYRLMMDQLIPPRTAA
ncbi:MAG: tetraacyldisaccharide 4'-kinase [Elusimicrobia bacterium]|nr:MAG: tetraacyldisaccharide 4'-kinase [Elusimicrobiota bacterium]KAF0156597.1 MAG: tetraacyldisaccharide 4'-kinase [Elusimicrobiota bacterium]